jgi:hypothetical protein
MCLNKSWFDDAPERKAQRDKHGVTLPAAIKELQLANSTIYPCAVEMAVWLYQNWTLEQFMQLPVADRDFVMQVVETQFSYPGVRVDRRKRREAKRNRQSPALPA